jgi:hypothetical protein
LKNLLKVNFLKNLVKVKEDLEEELPLEDQ